MNSETVVMCVVALILGMLLAHMLKSVCGCDKVVEGATSTPYLYDPQRFTPGLAVDGDPVDNSVAGENCMTLAELENSEGCSNPWGSQDYGHCTCPPGTIKVSEQNWFPWSGQGSCNICVDEESKLPLNSSKPLSITTDVSAEGGSHSASGIYKFDKAPCFSLFTAENCTSDSRCKWWGDQINTSYVGVGGGLHTVDGMRKCTFDPEQLICNSKEDNCRNYYAYQMDANYEALIPQCNDYYREKKLTCSNDSLLVTGFTGFNGQTLWPKKD